MLLVQMQLPCLRLKLLKKYLVEVVKYLVSHGHPLFVRDRWGATPLDEAKREKRENVIKYLLGFNEPDVSLARKAYMKQKKVHNIGQLWNNSHRIITFR